MTGIFLQAWQQLTGINFIFYYELPPRLHLLAAAASSSPTKKGAAPPAAIGTGAGVAKTNAGRAAGSGLSAVDPIEITSDGPEVTIIEIGDDEDENDSDAFVDMLLEKHEELRQRESLRQTQTYWSHVA
ncbi:Plasma membrane low glucose sensor [Tilletia horrida]|uniref:Plasma membrane low glucose sensor n=1 Tax=Tilletia horrida TaxID=155126 RepID=A0AAN6JGF9_9BASI|nr:Plasma membrane low glucose sensor [Tilletia horrida]